MKECNGSEHRLIVIWRETGAASDAVVRWCQDCGAVVVDEDYDGRTHAGRYMAMRFPNRVARGSAEGEAK